MCQMNWSSSSHTRARAPIQIVMSLLWNATASVSICYSASNIYFYCLMSCLKKTSNRIAAIEINESPPPKNIAVCFSNFKQIRDIIHPVYPLYPHHMWWYSSLRIDELFLYTAVWLRWSKCGLKPFCNRSPFKMLNKQCRKINKNNSKT